MHCAIESCQSLRGEGAAKPFWRVSSCYHLLNITFMCAVGIVIGGILSVDVLADSKGGKMNFHLLPFATGPFLLGWHGGMSEGLRHAGKRVFCASCVVVWFGGAQPPRRNEKFYVLVWVQTPQGVQSVVAWCVSCIASVDWEAMNRQSGPSILQRALSITLWECALSPEAEQIANGATFIDSPSCASADPENGGEMTGGWADDVDSR